MSGAEVAVAVPAGPRWRVAGRRGWRAFRLALHLLLGVLWTLWLEADRDAQRAEVWQAQQRWCRRLLVILGVEVRVTGALRGGPVLLAGNHVSWLDVPVLAAVRPCRFLAKSEVAGWPLIGWLARCMGTLFLRRGAGEARCKAAQINERLRMGQTVLIFPEGTTSDGTSVRRFYRPLFAAAGPAPVQPVAIRYLHPPGPTPLGGQTPAGPTPGGGAEKFGEVDTGVAYWGEDRFLRHLWCLLGRRRIVVRLHFGAPIAAGSTAVLAARAREDIVAALAGNSDFFFRGRESVSGPSGNAVNTSL